MTSIDDALPLARPARPPAIGLKSNNGDEGGGDAFRKAFEGFGKPQDGSDRTASQKNVKTDHGDRVVPRADDALVADAWASGDEAQDAAQASETDNAHARAAAAPKAQTGAARLMKSPEALAYLSRVAADMTGDVAGAVPLKAGAEEKPQDATASAVDIKAPKATSAAQLLPHGTAPAAPETSEPGARSGWPDPKPFADLPRVAGVAKSAGKSETAVMRVETDPEARPPAPNRKVSDPSSRLDARRVDARLEPTSAKPEATLDAQAPAAADMPSPSAQADLRTLMALLGPAPASAPAQASTDLPPSAGNMVVERPKAGLSAPVPAAATQDEPVASAGEEPDRIFRVARQDTRTAALYLRGGVEGGKGAVSPDVPASKVENVTVLDARRYLGVAPTAGGALPMSVNAQSVTQSVAQSLGMSPSPSAPASLLDSAAGPTAGAGGATGKVVNTLKIQMHPIDLGLVTATLRLRGDDLQIDLRVRTGEAYRQLSDDQDAMIKALQAQGFQVDQVNVVYAPADSGAGNDASGQQGNQPPPQPGRDGQSGFAPGGGDRNGGSGQRSADERRGLNDIVRETAPQAQPGVSDDLYL